MRDLDKVCWGIIGCGDVTEMKSGPAFNKVPHSRLVAVMRRNASKAADYAARHEVDQWYADATELINDSSVNAIYIATPPASHLLYARMAMEAGKPVYVEKPMAMDANEAIQMADLATDKNVKLTVAHYRRGHERILFIKKLLDNKAIGKIQSVKLAYHRKPLSPESLQIEKTAWRVDPAISGGGLFHDIAPHQLDLVQFFFGTGSAYDTASGNRAGLYTADDFVSGKIQLKDDIQFFGTWRFDEAPVLETDSFEIIGSDGAIRFGVFENKTVTVTRNNKEEIFRFDELMHVQQPMIEKVVQYFRGDGKNPCSGEEGVEVMKWMDAFTGK